MGAGVRVGGKNQKHKDGEGRTPSPAEDQRNCQKLNKKVHLAPNFAGGGCWTVGGWGGGWEGWGSGFAQGGDPGGPMSHCSSRPLVSVDLARLLVPTTPGEYWTDLGGKSSH